MGYEAARAALVQIVRSLEVGAETLEESLALWERGEALAQRCEHWLRGAQERMAAVTHAGSDDEDAGGVSE
jgi:exodeoxyribonuclease VII small subunit